MGSAPPPPTTKLFEPLQLGNLTLSHRIIMAPLTRFRNSDSHSILPIASEYYSQRASVPGTLLISEASPISKRASGYSNIPGIWNSEQISAWKNVVDAVHAKGSYIYMQLWALGRVASEEVKEKEGTGDVVSSSATPVEEGATVPRELNEEEIRLYISDYASAAEIAVKEVGFDGVEIHGANGYLIDQFTQDVCNVRNDKWGGSIENRARFAIEVTKAVVKAVGAEKTAMRLSPFSPWQGMKMQEPLPQFLFLVKELRKMKLAYLHLVEARVASNDDVPDAPEKLDQLIEAYGDAGTILIAGGFTPEKAKKAVDEEYKGKEVGIVFGRYFISNPDLVYRVKNGIELRKYDRKTFYVPKEPKGYLDYPYSEEFVKEFGVEQVKVIA